MLCSRLCADRDHMHGLLESSVHLCGLVNKLIQTQLVYLYNAGKSIPVSRSVAQKVFVTSKRLRNPSKLPSRVATSNSNILRFVFQQHYLDKTNLSSSSTRKVLDPAHELLSAGLIDFLTAHRRLPCVAVIPPNCLEHKGPHTHNIDNPFHFCETR
jgi:hypothetical protein